MQRLGLCCLFLKAPISFKTTTVKYVSTLSAKGKEPLEYIDKIIQHNLKNLLLAVDFCANNDIHAFRVNSGLLPIYTHPKLGYELNDLPNIDIIKNGFHNIKERAYNKNIRLTFHPDQFVVLNSPREDVVEKSLADLEYHGMLAKLLGADVINIHGGGGYGDKVSALKRFAENFYKLSKNVQRILTVENDDKVFTPEDLLPLCRKLDIPFVYDVHHHRCLPDRLSIREATEQALTTWQKEPLFHISSPKEGWKSSKTRLHSDFMDPEDVPDEWKDIDPLTIDIEAKAKELAVLKIKKQLKKKGWKLL